MIKPLVCAVMLTRDRPEMAARAVASFRAQTYAAKRLFILDTSANPNANDKSQADMDYATEEWFYGPYHTSLSIGRLRNYANQLAKSWTGFIAESDTAKILIHWDDDDYSHPNRIGEQVGLLEYSGAEAVGYVDMLFWREPNREAWFFTGGTKNYALGTSLCYWRQAWERRPFLNENQGVEEKWCRDIKVESVSSMRSDPMDRYPPRMMARIHPGNTSTGYDLERHVAMGSEQWERLPGWDAYCEERMKL
jgi:hypothetical protein